MIIKFHGMESVIQIHVKWFNLYMVQFIHGSIYTWFNLYMVQFINGSIYTWFNLYIVKIHHKYINNEI
jgi:hypothetical protein